MNPYLRETLDRVHALINQGHVSAEIKKALLDLVAVIDNLETLKNDNTSISADKRYIQAKLNEAVSERRKIENDLQKIRTAMAQSLPPTVKDISAEINFIAQQGKELKDIGLSESADRLRAQLRTLVETLTSAGQK